MKESKQETAPAQTPNDVYQEEANNEVNDLASRETKWIGRSRCLVLGFLFVAAALSAFGAFYSSKQFEEATFKTKFNEFSDQIRDVSQINAVHVFDSFNAYSRQLTAHVRGTGRKWPFIVLPNFSAGAYHIAKQTGVLAVLLVPIVYDAQREAYENHTYDNRGWVDDAFAFEGIPRPDYFEFSFMFDVVELDDGTIDYVASVKNDVYTPIRYAYPLSNPYFASSLGGNVLSFPQYSQTFHPVINSRMSLLSRIEIYDEYADFDINDPFWWPAGLLHIPIFEDFSANSTIVGVIVSEMPWHRYFVNLIPPGINGIFLVVDDGCGDTFTLEINGPALKYLGKGDLHDPSFDKYRNQIAFSTFQTIPECSYTFSIYPSTTFQSDFAESNAFLNALVVACTFVVTALVFVIYDTLVERRQHKIQKLAARSGAIVNSLFPSQVRNRLLRESNAAKKDSNNEHAFLASKSTDSKIDVAGQQAKPIADLFPSATVFFADLVGFAGWSASHSSTEIFTLLETLYNAMDKVAVELGVFKVETIGECYMAVAGLPAERPDHASAMASFARSCMKKSEQVIEHLDEQLKITEANMAMRIGLHSGPVTAGVLRGQKTRFQLFGDTVNTAARMETTGVGGRIHTSQATADLLAADGKLDWVDARADKVKAKGKGELQTYWIRR